MQHYPVQNNYKLTEGTCADCRHDTVGKQNLEHDVNSLIPVVYNAADD